MTDKELDDLFKNSFTDHKMPVPADMWSRIQEKEKRRRGILLWPLLTAAAVLLISTSVWLYTAHENDSGSLVSRTSQSSEAGNTQPNSKEQSSSGKDRTSNGSIPAEDKDSSFFNKEKNLVSSWKNQRQPAASAHQSKGKSDLFARVPDEKMHSLSQTTMFDSSMSSSSSPETEAENYASKEEIANPFSGVENTDSSALQTTKLPSAEVEENKNNLPAEEKNAGVQLNKKDTKPKPAIEVMIAGYAANRDLTSESGLSFSPQASPAANPASSKSSASLHGYSANVRVEIPLSRHIGFKTGLQYLQTFQRASYEEQSTMRFLVATTLSNNSDTSGVSRLSVNKMVLKSIYNNISLPLLVTYHTNGSRMQYGAAAGVLLNLFSWYSGEVPNGNSRKRINASDVFRANAGTSVYLGVQASRSFGSWQLFAEPHLQRSLSSLTKQSASFNQKITYYGIGIGVRKTLK